MFLITHYSSPYRASQRRAWDRRFVVCRDGGRRLHGEGGQSGFVAAEGVEVDGRGHAGAARAVVMLPEHPVALAESRLDEQAAHPEALASEFTQMRVVKFTRDVEDRAHAVVPLDDIEI